MAYPFNYGFLAQALLKKDEGGDGDPHDIAVLDEKFNGITSINETFFNNYKGRGKMKSDGWRDEVYTKSLIDKAAKGFAKHST